VLIHSDAARRGALEEHQAADVWRRVHGHAALRRQRRYVGRLMVTLASVFVTADDRPLRHLERDLEWLLRQYITCTG
jgi:hypothetical protein